MALIPDEANQFKAKISCRAQWDVLEKIKGGLRGRSKKLFKKSCFGHFWEVPRIQFQGQLYLHLLFRQDTRHSTERIVFHMNGHKTVFGPKEFCLVTGLRFGSLPSYPEASNFHKDIFQGVSNIYVSDIEELFETTCNESGGDSQKCLKLALLYFLEGVLVARDKTTKKIEIKHLHLLDDVKKFNSHPWGQVAFDNLTWDIRRFQNRLEGYKKRKEKKSKHKEERFDANGFAYALQVWAYEAMPVIANSYGSPVPNWENTFPRMLRYKPDERPSFDDFKRNFFPTMIPGDNLAAHIEVIARLKPTPEEKRTPYYISLVTWKSRIKKISRKRKDDNVVTAPQASPSQQSEREDVEVEAACRGNKRKRRAELDGPSQPHTVGSVSKQIEMLEERVNQMEKKFEMKIDELKEIMKEVLSELKKRADRDCAPDRESDWCRDTADILLTMAQKPFSHH